MTAMSAIILCGGQSRRMGTDKAWLDFNGEPLLHRICRLTVPAVERLVVVAGQMQSLPDLPQHCDVVRDLYPNEGPLGGLLTGLHFLDEIHDAAPLVWLNSSDSPYVNAHAISALGSLLQFDVQAQAVIPTSAGRQHPLNAVYRRSISAAVGECFATGQRSLKALIARLTVRLLDLDDSDFAAFDQDFTRNVNTPDDLQEALRILKRSTHASDAD
ncbi:MAG: molybdenum cofactor guanylyltransferase [Planctomycetaceae bacterium]